MAFAFLVAVACLVPSLLFLPAYKAEWIVFQFPKLPDDYTHASYFGTIWTIQATLIALVYPIVLTFVPILLSRRAASKFALNFYLRNSAVLPAGLSSLSLLGVMTVLYLFAYYIPNTLFLFGVGFTGLWLLANLALTGTFLVRTLQYVEEQVGEEVFVSHSIHDVLWKDLHNSLVTWLYQKKATSIGDSSRSAETPFASFFATRSGPPAVTLTFKTELLLSDVNLAALKRVAASWHDRASRLNSGAAASRPASTGRKTRPLLEFVPLLGRRYEGEVALARVYDGPPLLDWEIDELKRSFVFTKPRRQLVSGTTADVLAELASEVQAQLEQDRFAAAAVAFKRLRRLHEVLLKACAPLGRTADGPTAAMLVAPWSWSSRSVNEGWLETYRALTRATISKLSVDREMWTLVVGLSGDLTRNAELSDPDVVGELLTQFTWLDHLLGGWWTKEVQKAQLHRGPAGETLPEPLAADYEDALTDIANALIRFPNRTDRSRGDDGERWKEWARVTYIWLAHLNVCAELLLGAVKRGDVAAAKLYSDCLLHWQVDRSYQYNRSGFDDYFVTAGSAALAAVELDWSDAQALLAQEVGPTPTIERAVKHLWQSLRWHWEAMRLTCALLAIQQGRETDRVGLGGQIGSSLLSMQFFRTGLNEDGADLHYPGILLATFIKLSCLDGRTAEHMRGVMWSVNETGGPRTTIFGWSHTGHGYIASFETLVRQVLTLALASGESYAADFPEAQELVGSASLEELRKILAMLERMLQYFGKGQARALAIESASLMQSLGRLTPQFSPLPRLRRSLLRLMKEVRMAIDTELRKLQVSEESVRHLVSAVSQGVLASPPLNWPWPLQVRRTTLPSRAPHSTQFKLTKGEAIQREAFRAEAYPVQQFATDVIHKTIPSALPKFIAAERVLAIRGEYNGERLLNIAAAISAMRWAGKTPVVLAPAGLERFAVDPSRWWKNGVLELPHGVELNRRAGPTAYSTQHTVNGAPVVYSDLKGDAFYVLPEEDLAALVFKEQADGNVFAFDFQVEEPDTVWLNLSWDAWFSPTGQ